MVGNFDIELFLRSLYQLHHLDRVVGSFDLFLVPWKVLAQHRPVGHSVSPVPTGKPHQLSSGMLARRFPVSKDSDLRSKCVLHLPSFFFPPPLNAASPATQS